MFSESFFPKLHKFILNQALIRFYQKRMGVCKILSPFPPKLNPSQLFRFKNYFLFIVFYKL